MAGRRWSWKTKIALLVLGLLFFLFIFISTSDGQQWLADRMTKTYNEMPEEQRRDSSLATWWRMLAYWRGNICGYYDPSYEMYKEFCGLGNGYNINWKIPKLTKFAGKCSADGKTGWGPLHPDAPDAYYEYLKLYQPQKVAAWTQKEAENYYYLFYEWPIRTQTDKRPHPKFSKYWPQVQQMILDGHLGRNEGMDLKAPLALPWTEGS